MSFTYGWNPISSFLSAYIHVQDPSTIEHGTAPTGDVYAVTEKKSKKGHSDEDIAAMYSIPDKFHGSGVSIPIG